MALGKIKADTLEHSTAGSLDTSYVVNGSAKAWCNMNGTGTIAIRGSLNTTSITDNGTGDYSVTAVTAMTDTNYVCSSTSGQNSGDQISANNNLNGSLARTTSVVRTQCQRSTSDNALDCGVVETIRMGDLA